MALTQDDFVGAVARLNDLTRRQVIRWSPCAPTTAPHAGLSTAVKMFTPRLSFEATYDDRIYGLHNMNLYQTLCCQGHINIL